MKWNNKYLKPASATVDNGHPHVYRDFYGAISVENAGCRLWRELFECTLMFANGRRSLFCHCGVPCGIIMLPDVGLK